MPRPPARRSASKLGRQCPCHHHSGLASNARRYRGPRCRYLGGTAGGGRRGWGALAADGACSGCNVCSGSKGEGTQHGCATASGHQDLFYPPGKQASWQTPPNHLWTIDILTDLQGVEESPWSSIRRDGKGIDSRGLAQRLKRYSISSTTIRGPHGSIGKGYFRHAFEDAWARYLPPLPTPPVTPVTPQVSDPTAGQSAAGAASSSTTSQESVTSVTSVTPQVSDPVCVTEDPRVTAAQQFFAATGPFAPPDPSTNGNGFAVRVTRPSWSSQSPFARGVCVECALANPEPTEGASS